MEVRVTVVGLSGAGKSTLVEQLAQQDGSHTFISTTPTTPDEGRMELHEPSEGPLRGFRVIEMQQIPDDTLWS